MTLTPKAPSFKLKNFVLPTRYARSYPTAHPLVAAIIPTYKPGSLTLKLVEDLTRWNPQLSVYVVDDSTPRNHAGSRRIFKRLRRLSKRVTLLRTPANKLKAGALNYALEHLEHACKRRPDVIISLDDDVVIAPSTIPNLVAELMSQPHLGAVCSQCGVLNKDKNILTRLQGLEYLGFNATRLADEGWDPLESTCRHASLSIL